LWWTTKRKLCFTLFAEPLQAELDSFETEVSWGFQTEILPRHPLALDA